MIQSKQLLFSAACLNYFQEFISLASVEYIMLLQKGLAPLSCDKSVLSILDFKELQLLFHGVQQAQSFELGLLSFESLIWSGKSLYNSTSVS